MKSISRRRMPTTYRQVAHALKAQILTGKLGPGQQLETNVKLQRRFGTTPVTVHRAIQSLVAEGFLHAREGVGTFVADRPPHLSNYALVFPFDPAAPYEGEQRSWSKYYQAITAAAVELQRELGSRLALFHGIGYHADSEDRQRLLDRIRSHRLAGIFFTSSPHALAGTPILDEPGIPRVVLGGGQPWPHISAVTFDVAHWLSQALDRLHQRGCRRVALLCFRLTPEFEDQVTGAFAAQRLVCPARWRQAADWHHHEAISHCVQMLLHGPAAERPDGLLVIDDNLVDGVTAGLVAAGLRVPADVEVVAHANYPLLAQPALPFHLLGYDLGAALRTGLELIDCQRRGETVKGLTALPAIWREDVVKAATRAGTGARPVCSRREETAVMQRSSV